MATISKVDKVDATFTAADQVTGWISPYDANPRHIIDMGITGNSFVGTIMLQKRQVINGVATTEVDVESFTEDIQQMVEDPVPSVEYRLKCSAFTSGTAYVELYK